MTIKILFTSWYSGLGGGETDLLTLAQGLDQTRYEPHLLLPRVGELGTQWQANGWPVHYERWRGATTWFVPRLWVQFPVVTRMKELLKSQRIDIVHADYHTLPLIVSAAQSLNIPVMWTCHGWWFQPKPWQRGFFQAIPCVARSEAIRDGFLGPRPFLSQDQLPVVYSGVDTTRFTPSKQPEERMKANIPLDAPVVAMIARFQRVKGHYTFLAMARCILEMLPNAHFLIAGEDTFGVARDADYRQQVIENIQADSQLREHVHLLGFRADVEHVLQAADVVVCPSEFESYGKVNLEAMACGVPVVSTNKGGPSETVKDGETGYLIEAGDVDGFAQAVLSLLQNPQQRAQLGKQARAWVEEHFSAKQMVKQYEETFERLLARSS